MISAPVKKLIIHSIPFLFFGIMSIFTYASISYSETLTSSADVTVQNAIGFSEVRSLTFGTIVAISEGTPSGSSAAVTVNVAADNDTALTNAGGPFDDTIIELIPGNRAEYSITGAAPNTDLNVTLPPIVAIPVTCATCSPGTPNFDAYPILSNASGNTITTDASGNATLYVGGYILTDSTAISPYEDGLYTATYDVSVNY